MSSLNRVILIGNIGRDTEVRTTNSGQKIANFSLATSERWRDKNSGESKEATEWHRIVIFNEKLADIAERYCTKGKTVCVEGSIKSRKWQDASGVEKVSTEIVIDRFNGSLTLLGGRGEGNDERREPAPAAAVPSRAQRARSIAEELSDDIPF